MKYYLDITLLPDAEASLGFLWHKIYQQVHLAIVDNKTLDNTSEVAISIPKYKKGKHPLGNTLRLLAPTKAHLKQMDINLWLEHFTDYAHCKSIREIPKEHGFVVVQRKHVKSEKDYKIKQERMIKWRLQNAGETLEQASREVEGGVRQSCKLPFIHVQSLSADKRFQLFINAFKVKEAVLGKYSCYGLSVNGTTVPDFD
jgi:CRISPR-associated endonuclease Csy4